MVKWLFFLLSVSFVLGVSGLDAAPNPVADPLGCSIEGNLFYRYRLFDPGTATAENRLPLVIFLHGLGEREKNEVNGEVNTRQVKSHISGLIRKTQGTGTLAAEYPAFLLAPQNINGWFRSSSVEQLVEAVCQRYPVDRRKIYVTGLSAGGRGTWEMLGDSAGVYAAGVPLSAVQAPSSISDIATSGTAVWAFHGDNDNIVNVAQTRNMINGNPSGTALGINDLGGQARYTERAGWGHTDWNHIYSESAGWTTVYEGSDSDNTEPLLYEWLFAQSSPKPRVLLPGEKIMIDFGNQFLLTTRALDRTRYWNNALRTLNGDNEPPVLPEFMRTENGVATFTSLTKTRDFSGHSGTGVRVSTVFPEVVQRDSWVVGTFSGHAAALANPGEVTVSGLIPGAPYQVRCFASQTTDDGGRGYLTRYFIGTQWRDLNPIDNTENLAVFELVYASSNGQLVMQVGVSPENETGRFAHLGALELTALTPEVGTYAAWALGSQVATAEVGLLSDQDGDGKVALIEYLLGGDPDTSDAPSMARFEGVDQFCFAVSATASDGLIIVQGNNDLSSVWTDVAMVNLSTSQIENVSLGISNDPSVVIYKYTPGTAGSQEFQFYRLKGEL